MMKLFLQINLTNNCLLHQDDLNFLIIWSESLGFSLNVTKCSVFTFFWSCSHINFIYHIHKVPISLFGDSIRDLGFIFTRNLFPYRHIEEICCKTLKILGFILRVSNDFKLLTHLKSLYCALVHSILEHGSVL